MNSRIARRFTLVAALIGITILLGTVGFHLVAGYPIFDAFYMTVFTITTVGYMEVHPLSTAGRIFNSALILFGVCVIFFAIGAVTQTVIELEIQDFFGKRRRKRLIDNLENHIIVCGYGRVGRNASGQLKRAGAPVIVIDRNDERVQRALEAGHLAVVADSTRDETLREAGVTRARGLVSALATDADNLFVILSAKTLNPKLTVVTRVAEEEAEEKLRRAGADVVLAPYSMTGFRLAESILRPHVATFMDVATKRMGLDLVIEQVLVDEGSELAHKTLREMQLRRELGVIVLAIRRAEGEMVFNPPADLKILPGDYLIAMGQPPDLEKMEQALTASRNSS